MLQDFLNNNFIQITEDGNLTKLKKAADDIVKKLGKDKSKIVSYTLVAFDPQVPAENPIIDEVKSIIIKFWSTFPSIAKDTPVTYIRAVILEALETLSKDAIGGGLIWYTARNLVKRFNLNGKEKELVTAFLLTIGNKIEAEAIENWAVPSDANANAIIFDLKSITADLISSTEMQNRFKLAAVHTDGSGENPNYTFHQNGNWAIFFAQNAGTGVSAILNNAFRQKTKDINANFVQIQEKLNSAISNIHDEFIVKNGLFQIRTNLLWWKEAAYSSSLKKSYRELDNGLLHLIMANDYCQFIPSVYPVSVEYFLVETLKGLNGKDESEVKISDILKSVKSSSDTIKQIFTESSIQEGRKRLIDFIIGLSYDKYKINQFKSIVGFSETTYLSYNEFILWLFHDFQTNKLLNK